VYRCTVSNLAEMTMAELTTCKLTNRRGQDLHCYYWQTERPPRCLVLLSHGFSEHLGIYKEIAQILAAKDYLVFGHDHIGHGESDGKRAYIENVDHYVDDIIHHSMELKEKYKELPIYIIGHSMGGMIALRSVLRHPGYFSGMILNGPLVIPGPQIGPIDLRSTPIRTFVSKTVLQLLSWIIPEVPLGRPNLRVITRDEQAQRQLERDPLRWTGGCKVMLLLAFVYCLDDNINQLTDVRTPFLLVHGEMDRLCNPLGSDLLYRRSQSTEKMLKIYPGACHQLFLETPQTKNQVFTEILSWIEDKLN